MVDLYHCNAGTGTGLSMVHKLKQEHIHLTSFSKVRVDLAAQVILFDHFTHIYMCTFYRHTKYNSVAQALKLTGGPGAEGTAKFIEMIDKFF